MVYVDISDMGWQPFVDSWLQRIVDEVRVRVTVRVRVRVRVRGAAHCRRG